MGFKTKRMVDDCLKAELSKEEYKQLTFVQGHHPVAVITVAGKTLNLSFPRSPSDTRWFLNWRGHFRREYRRLKGG